MNSVTTPKTCCKTCRVGLLTVRPVASLVQDTLLILLDNKGFETGVIDEGSASGRITVLKDKDETELLSSTGGNCASPAYNEITLVAGNRRKRRVRGIGILL